MAEQGDQQPDIKSLTFKQRTDAETPAAPVLSSDERAFWQNIFDRAHHPQPLSDPKFYPIELLGSTENFILSGRGPTHEEARHKLIPMSETIRKVKTAYEILAYPHCRDLSDRTFIKGDLMLDMDIHERHSVQLTDKENMLLATLLKITNIPSVPRKATYSHSEVLTSPVK